MTIPPGFLADILANPDDDTPRLILADFLEETAVVSLCQACCDLPDWADLELKSRVDELMSGGPLGDGVGPGNAAKRINAEWGRSYTGEGIHGVWQRGKPWFVEKCLTCKGQGTVPDGRAARADLIRIQIEIARMEESGEPCEIDPHEGHTCCDDPCMVCQSVERYDTLRRRERELFDRHWPQWSGEPERGYPVSGKVAVRVRTDEQYDNDIEYEFRRGFVESIKLPWLRFAGGPCERCPDCRGEGHAPGIEKALVWWPGAVDVCPGCKGEKRRYVHDAEATRYNKQIGRHPMIPRQKTIACPECSGKGTIPRPMPATAQPIREVVLTDYPIAPAVAEIGWQGPDTVLGWLASKWPTVKFALPDPAGA